MLYDLLDLTFSTNFWFLSSRKYKYIFQQHEPNDSKSNETTTKYVEISASHTQIVKRAPLPTNSDL